MKKLIPFCFILCLLLSLTGCSQTPADLKFYVVSAGEAKESTTDEELFRLARKKGRIALTGEDLQGVVWEEQKFQLKGLDTLGGSGNGGSAIFQSSAEDILVVALGNQLIYTGGFAPAAGSQARRNPYVQDESATVFTLQFDEKYGNQDARWSDKLYRFLQTNQLLLASLSDENV